MTIRHLKLDTQRLPLSACAACGRTIFVAANPIEANRKARRDIEPLSIILIGASDQALPLDSISKWDITGGRVTRTTSPTLIDADFISLPLIISSPGSYSLSDVASRSYRPSANIADGKVFSRSLQVTEIHSRTYLSKPNSCPPNLDWADEMSMTSVRRDEDSPRSLKRTSASVRSWPKKWKSRGTGVFSAGYSLAKRSVTRGSFAAWALASL